MLILNNLEEINFSVFFVLVFVLAKNIKVKQVITPG